MAPCAASPTVHRCMWSFDDLTSFSKRPANEPLPARAVFHRSWWVVCLMICTRQEASYLCQN